MVNEGLSSRFEEYRNAGLDAKAFAIREVFQEIVLFGLSEASFFDRAGFYGGTALRLFVNLPRFSEDLDFTLLSPEGSARIDQAFPSIRRSFLSCGVDLPIDLSIKEKKGPSNIMSGFVSVNLADALALFFGESSSRGVNPDQKLKIKIECDERPALGFASGPAFRAFPFPYKMRVLDRPSLFAGKLAACLARQWHGRVKGRDFYDLAYLLGLGTKVNMAYLENKLKQTGLYEGDRLRIEDVKAMLRERFALVDWREAREDVEAFLKPGTSLSYFEKDFFSSIVEGLVEA